MGLILLVVLAVVEVVAQQTIQDPVGVVELADQVAAAKALEESITIVHRVQQTPGAEAEAEQITHHQQEPAVLA